MSEGSTGESIRSGDVRSKECIWNGVLTLDIYQGIDERACIWSEDVASNCHYYEGSEESSDVRRSGYIPTNPAPSTFNGLDLQLVMAWIIRILEHIKQEGHDRPIMLQGPK